MDSITPTPQSTQDEREFTTEYVEDTEELAVFWINPYTKKKEKIASFWWPEHPPQFTSDVERIFESLVMIPATSLAQLTLDNERLVKENGELRVKNELQHQSRIDLTNQLTTLKRVMGECKQALFDMGMEHRTTEKWVIRDKALTSIHRELGLGGEGVEG